MNRLTILILVFTCNLFSNTLFARNEPDSAYIFAYATSKNMGKNGLHIAWSIDRKNWQSIGPENRFLFSDYGTWGSEKRMVTPFLFHDKNNLWHCLWSLNEYDGVFAHAYSKDLVNWSRQSYPKVVENNNVSMLEVSYNPAQNNYQITWQSNPKGEIKNYYCTTSDFHSYSETIEFSGKLPLNYREKVLVDGSEQTGTIYKVAWPVIEKLINSFKIAEYNRSLENESARTDSARLAPLKSPKAEITVDLAAGKKISDLLVGVFFEDINYAADGGLYAELIENRDFEYTIADTKGRDTSWHSFKAWSLLGTGIRYSIKSENPIHVNNPNYVELTIEKPGGALVNRGFDSISLKKGETYNFSLFARVINPKATKIKVKLTGPSNQTYAETTISVISATWKKLETQLIANSDATRAKLEIIPQNSGTIDLDFISLFPQNTFKQHKNGLRADLAQTIADIHPRFVRFPGGCVSHGDGLANIYRWKNTIGPVESRKSMPNIWRYHQSMGLGYFEYFQFCEDIGALPLPVIAAGVPCQNSATGGAGQQGGIPMCDMDGYVQDILDLIEWANGDVKTTWGKKRAEAGHPKPFNLKYVGIGNEDLITDIFEERFTMIYKALKEKHPEITVIGTVGPFFEGTDYVEGWQIASKLNVPMVDEHYYQSPGWFVNNQDFYDKYDRSKSKVYLGEYASRGNTLYNALSEAIYMTALERNADVVYMASYAPLLAKEKHTQWNPDLVYFNNSEVKPTVNYYVQQLFGQNSGSEYFQGILKLSENREAYRKRVGFSVVKTSQNEYVVKLANLLPIEVSGTFDFTGIEIPETETKGILLSGKPSDKNSKPVEITIKTGKKVSYTIPPYSFTLFKMKPKL